jgi:hypothetical protein
MFTLFFLEAFCDISHRLGGITSFGVFSDAFPGLKMWVTFACATTAIFLTRFIISIAVLEKVPLTKGYRKEPLFHTKRRSIPDWESNPGHLLGRQRHYTLSHPLRLCSPVTHARVMAAPHRVYLAWSFSLSLSIMGLIVRVATFTLISKCSRFTHARGMAEPHTEQGEAKQSASK